MVEAGAIENDVLIGRDGYLFLVGGVHKVSDFVAGTRRVDARFYRIFGDNLRGRAGWAARNNAQYLHLIMPDKQSIIPEAWTIDAQVCLGADYVAELPELDHLLVYPAALLAAHKQRAVSTIDTHLTAFGSLLVAKHLVEKLSGASQEKVFNELAGMIDREITSAGDLGSKLTPPVQAASMTWRADAPGVFLSNLIPGGNNGVIDLRFNPQAPYAKRVALFGDSFGRDVARVLQFWYSEVYFFRTGYFHPEMADLCKPDILITENVERYLDHCLVDEDHPHFLLFPYLNELPYAPAVSFAEALSAVLSYPRTPYHHFISKLNRKYQRPVALPPSPPPAPVEAPLAAAAMPGMNVAQRYYGARMTEPPEEEGVLQILEAQAQISWKPPEFILDIMGMQRAGTHAPAQDIHGSYLVRRENVLLFGPNHLISPEGHWSCETRAFKRQYLNHINSPAYNAAWPGIRPIFNETAPELRLSIAGLGPNDIEFIDEPVFLATPLEPSVWGRWIATVVPKIAQYKQYGGGRKFFCVATLGWQKQFLQLLGVAQAQILNHDPGRTYICRDVMTVEYSVTNMTVSALERMNLFEMVAMHQVKMQRRPKLFVSASSQNNRDERVLQNGQALREALEASGFVAVEPESLLLEEQISLFGQADEVVFLGGAGLYNAAFCAPGTSVITIEASDNFIGPHTEFLASLGMRYGVIFGVENPEDPSPVYKNWSVDIVQVREAVSRFFSG